MAVSDREIGELIGDVKAIKRDMTRMENDTKDIKAAVDRFSSRFDQMDGAWKMAVWGSGVIGALVMFAITKAIPLVLSVLPRI